MYKLRMILKSNLGVRVEYDSRCYSPELDPVLDSVLLWSLLAPSPRLTSSAWRHCDVTVDGWHGRVTRSAITSALGPCSCPPWNFVWLPESMGWHGCRVPGPERSLRLRIVVCSKYGIPVSSVTWHHYISMKTALMRLLGPCFYTNTPKIGSGGWLFQTVKTTIFNVH